MNSGSTTVVTAIVAYALGVAGLTKLGASLGQTFCPLRVFRWMTAVFLVGVQLFIVWTQSRPAAGQALLLLAIARQQHSVQGFVVPSYSGRIEKIGTVPIESRPAIFRPPIGSSPWSARGLRRLIPRRV